LVGLGFKKFFLLYYSCTGVYCDIYKCLQYIH
jgi:hypothetical protein